MLILGVTQSVKGCFKKKLCTAKIGCWICTSNEIHERGHIENIRDGGRQRSVFRVFKVSISLLCVAALSAPFTFFEWPAMLVTTIPGIVDMKTVRTRYLRKRHAVVIPADFQSEPNLLKELQTNRTRITLRNQASCVNSPYGDKKRHP